MESVTPAQALNHPTWRMGKRITIDCATLMNKGFEVIEACWLFGFAPSQVDVVIHPQSTVHAMIEYSDGSVLAQISPTDMRIPIRRTDGNPYIGSYKNAWNGAVHNSSAPALVDEIILDTRPKLERIIASGQDAAAMTCNRVRCREVLMRKVLLIFVPPTTTP